jgi:hypothetical protein
MSNAHLTNTVPHISPYKSSSATRCVRGAALRKLAVRVDIEAKPPKLGPFIDAINAGLSDPRRLGKS